MLLSYRAQFKGDFARAISLSDEADDIMPLQAVFRVRRASLLLRMERVEEASRAFDALRQEFKSSTSPERRYLYHYCTGMLSLMQVGSGQWSDEATRANAINCRRAVKGLFPMVPTDDVHANIKRRSS
jgi:hypothetical protein